MDSRNPFKGMRRYPDAGWIGGVCGGIAVHFDWSLKVVRLLAVLLLFVSGGWAILAYLVLWYVLDPVQGATAPAAAGPGPAGPAGEPPADIGPLKTRFATLEARLRRIEECVTDQEYELRRELRKLET
jgi:phage shock protein C